MQVSQICRQILTDACENSWTHERLVNELLASLAAREGSDGDVFGDDCEHRGELFYTPQEALFHWAQYNQDDASPFACDRLATYHQLDLTPESLFIDRTSRDGDGQAFYRFCGPQEQGRLSAGRPRAATLGDLIELFEAA
jgi:hypothetical protein